MLGHWLSVTDEFRKYLDRKYRNMPLKKDDVRYQVKHLPIFREGFTSIPTSSVRQLVELLETREFGAHTSYVVAQMLRRLAGMAPADLDINVGNKMSLLWDLAFKQCRIMPEKNRDEFLKIMELEFEYKKWLTEQKEQE